MHHVSTISTAPVGGDEATRLTQAAAIAGTPYGLSKWIAGDLALRAFVAAAIAALIASAPHANATIIS